MPKKSLSAYELELKAKREDEEKRVQALAWQLSNPAPIGQINHYIEAWDRLQGRGGGGTPGGTQAREGLAGFRPQLRDFAGERATSEARDIGIAKETGGRIRNMAEWREAARTALPNEAMLPQGEGPQAEQRMTLALPTTPIHLAPGSPMRIAPTIDRFAEQMERIKNAVPPPGQWPQKEFGPVPTAEETALGLPAPQVESSNTAPPAEVPVRASGLGAEKLKRYEEGMSNLGGMNRYVYGGLDPLTGRERWETMKGKPVWSPAAQQSTGNTGADTRFAFQKKKYTEDSWLKAADRFNSLRQSSRSAIGVAALNNMRADRMLAVIDLPELTPADQFNLVADIQGIFKGGVPDEVALKMGGYKTAQKVIAEILTAVTSNPIAIKTPKIHAHLKNVAESIKAVDTKIIRDNAGVYGVAFRDLLESDPARATDLFNATMTPTQSPGQAGYSTVVGQGVPTKNIPKAYPEDTEEAW